MISLTVTLKTDVEQSTVFVEVDQHADKVHHCYDTIITKARNARAAALVELHGVARQGTPAYARAVERAASDMQVVSVRFTSDATEERFAFYGENCNEVEHEGHVMATSRDEARFLAYLELARLAETDLQNAQSARWAISESVVWSVYREPVTFDEFRELVKKMKRALTAELLAYHPAVKATYIALDQIEAAEAKDEEDE